jgi:hypothetical protein
VFRSSRVSAQNQSATLTNSRDLRHLPPSTGFLLNVARFFRNRALQVWGGIPAFNGVPLVFKSMNSIDNNHDSDNDLSLSTAAPNLLTSSSKNQPAVIDPLSYRVPCPRSSGGIFSTLGHISCFGGSRLFLHSMTQQRSSDPQSRDIEPPSQSRESSHHDINVTASHDDLILSSLPSTPVISHSSAQTKHGFYPRTQQHDLPPSSNTQQTMSLAPPQSPQRSSAPIIYPKTYGDLLVFQRDSKLTNQVKIKHNRDDSASGDVENDKLQHDKIQMPIKTTERYYGHFFLLQARKGTSGNMQT